MNRPRVSVSVESVLRSWNNEGVPPFEKQGILLKRGISLLERCRPTLKKDPLSLLEQPFDLHLLNWSPYYRRSRKLYLELGGKFIPTLVSSARSLSSSILLQPLVEYSPIERELVWTALDPTESRNLERLTSLRTYSSSLFHEQNHRILWQFLPAAPSEQKAMSRYLNFAESLVITLDMALADHLGPKLASLFYLTGVTYDPGTRVRQELKAKRQYRNYLQAALHATYLNLELYDPKDIPRAIHALFPNFDRFAERAAVRSGNLDRSFIQRTNLRWQKRNYEAIIQHLCTNKRKSRLDLPDDPMNNREQYLIAEKCFDLLGL